jgi:hypothetical protein
MHDPASHRPHPARAAVALAPSLLRLSAVQRLVIAAALSAILWLCVWWALSEVAT